VLSLQPLTATLVGTLKPDMTVESLAADLAEIGYAVDAQGAASSKRHWIDLAAEP
jgi:hypothetical protein